MLPAKLYHQRKLEKGVELQISCAECVVNRPKVCRTYWRGVGQTKFIS